MAIVSLLPRLSQGALVSFCKDIQVDEVTEKN